MQDNCATMKKAICYNLFILLLLSACNKHDDGGVLDPPITPSEGSRSELSLDSLYLYASQTYLWYDALPDYTELNPRKYAGSTDDLTALKQELFELVQYKTNPETGKPYEYAIGTNQGKYSFVEAGNVITGQQGTVSLEGQGDDFGLELSVVNNKEVYVRYVNASSPAWQAGLTRGCRVTMMNGAKVSVNPTILNSALAQASISLTVQKTDGSIVMVKLGRASYASSPVLKNTIINNGSKIIGYIAFARFSRLSGVQDELEAAFSAFAEAGVEDIIIDLRYNGGGYVETAEYFANLIVPSKITGEVMYAEAFNPLMQSGKASVLKSIPYLDNNRQQVFVNGHAATYFDVDYSLSGNTRKYSKKGSLQTAKNVAFIVSGSTASASELLINSLRPFLNVKLVGSKTYGKPVGFFGIGIDKYSVYLTQFKSTNARGEGDYFDGFTPDISAADDVTHDFGDLNEVAISKAVAWIAGGAPVSGRIMINGREIPESALTLAHSRESEFNGMIQSGTGMHLR